jgi:opacity protein-like surface antigen
MKKITLSYLIVLIFSFSSLYAQYNPETLKQIQNLEKFNNYLKINSFTPTVALGIQGGFARFESNTGMAVGMFAEIKTESFSLVPQANYWKVDKMNNFEMAGIARLRFKTGGMEPYVDGGIGINFLNDKTGVSERNDTKLGLDLGGGLDFVGAGANYSIFIDAKYKIIVGDPNIKGVVFSGGIKFSL